MEEPIKSQKSRHGESPTATKFKAVVGAIPLRAGSISEALWGKKSKNQSVSRRTKIKI